MSKKKNVLIAVPSFTYGGAESHGFAIARVISEMDELRPIMFSFSRRTDATHLYDQENIEYLQYFEPIAISDKWYVKLKKIILLVNFLRKHKIHAIISTTFNTNINLGLVWRFIGAKKFYWHQLGVNDDIPVTWTEKIVKSTGVSYVANSDWMKLNISNRHGISRKEELPVIYNIPQYVEPEMGREGWRTKLGIDPSSVVIIMVANYYPEKDFETLLLSFSKLRENSATNNINLILVGSAPGVSSLKMETKALAFDNHLSGSVQFLENVDDIYGLYQAADIGVLSTLSEGFSGSVLEYMHCGLPIVATRIPPNIEALPEASHKFLFEPKNVEECTSALAKLISNPSLRNSIGKVNVVSAKSRFTFKQLKQNYQELLRQV